MVLADGKNSPREPPAGRRPQKPQGSEAPRPPRRAFRSFCCGLSVVVRVARQPDILAIKWRASILQLHDVIDDHATIALRVHETYDDIVDVCCAAWNDLMAMPERIASIAARDWAVVS